MSVKAAKHAREMLLKEYQGVLSTHSKAMPGYPFGSVVPYCLDAQGRPLILISDLAQHTHNLKQDGHCSLLISERHASDAQAAGRLTILADASALSEDNEVNAAAERYYRYFPQAQDYHRAHDFNFWRLTPVRSRFIGGFGAIHWVEQLDAGNPFAAVGSEAGMAEHMNRDHAAALAHYVQLAGLPDHAPATMVGVDPEGFHLRIQDSLYWLAFPTSCNTPMEVRQALVALARADQWPPRADG